MESQAPHPSAPKNPRKKPSRLRRMAFFDELKPEIYSSSSCS
jgi:hypothetical protein